MMGHLVGKDLYQELGRKLDSLWFRAPQKEVFYTILERLYSTEEADVVIKMPYCFSNLGRIKKVTGYEESRLHNILDRLTSKGLVIDIWIKGEYYYQASPLVVGIFEFTMMRTGEDLDIKQMAQLMHEYMQGDDAFYSTNFADGQRISIMRALPHTESIKPSEYVEVLDYEKATALVEEADTFCVGICSCRHKKLHVGEKECDIPLESCTTFGRAADYLIRNHFGRAISKNEMLDRLLLSRERGLVLNADNVQHRIRFICQCCGCCCTVLQGVSKFGYPNTVVTSSFIAEVDEEKCIGCGKCAKACPIEAIEMVPVEDPDKK